LCVVAAIGFVVSIYLVFYNAPLDYQIDRESHRLVGTSLFFNQKIYFFHVPHAIMLFVAVFTAGIASIMYLWKHDVKWDDIAAGTVDVAVALGAAVLATGSIWAKAAWDVWWQWEPRLTMSLLLWLILAGYALVRKFAGPSGDRVAAGMAIFGMVGVPFIYTMVGKDPHPPSGLKGVVATQGASMAPAFWVSFATITLWFIILVITRVQGTRAEREVRELRERGLDLGVIE
jgi:heme exporter protein C